MVVRKLEIPPPIPVALNSIPTSFFEHRYDPSSSPFPQIVERANRRDNNFPVGCSSFVFATRTCAKWQFARKPAETEDPYLLGTSTRRGFLVATAKKRKGTKERIIGSDPLGTRGSVD